MTKFFISPGDPAGIGPEVTLKALSKNKKIGLYYPIGSEVSTIDIIQYLRKKNILFLYRF